MAILNQHFFFLFIIVDHFKPADILFIFDDFEPACVCAQQFEKQRRGGVNEKAVPKFAY